MLTTAGVARRAASLYDRMLAAGACCAGTRTTALRRPACDGLPVGGVAARAAPASRMRRSGRMAAPPAGATGAAATPACSVASTKRAASITVTPWANSNQYFFNSDRLLIAGAGMTRWSVRRTWSVTWMNFWMHPQSRIIVQTVCRWKARRSSRGRSSPSPRALRSSSRRPRKAPRRCSCITAGSGAARIPGSSARAGAGSRGLLAAEHQPDRLPPAAGPASRTRQQRAVRQAHGLDASSTPAATAT